MPVVLDTIVVVATGMGTVVDTWKPLTAQDSRPICLINFDSASRMADAPSLSAKVYEIPETGTGADVTVAQLPAPPVESATLVSWNSVYFVKTLYAVGEVKVAPAIVRRVPVNGI